MESNTSTTTDRVVQIMLDAAGDFFRSVGIADLKLIEESSSLTIGKESELLSSTLGFSGNNIKAALVVESNCEGIAATNPQREYKKDLDLTDHTDWIGEIANQMVGNLKRIFRGYGIDFTMGTPVVMTGGSVHLVSSNQNYKTLVFSVNNQYLKVSISVELSKDVNLETPNEQLKDEVSGGDTFLF